MILADRYVSSNLIHQASKIENQEEKDKFLTWLDDLEYNVYGLPRPNVTIFLDMPPKYGIELMKDRANKSNGGDKRIYTRVIYRIFKKAMIMQYMYQNVSAGNIFHVLKTEK